LTCMSAPSLTDELSISIDTLRGVVWALTPMSDRQTPKITTPIIVILAKFIVVLRFNARFETWRTNRKYLREPIPDDLWNAAADLSRRYPASVVGRVLKLEPKTYRNLTTRAVCNCVYGDVARVVYSRTFPSLSRSKISVGADLRVCPGFRR